MDRNLIKQALQNENYILLPNFADYFDPSDSKAAGLARIKSAMAAPIFSPLGVFGVIYINNGIDQEAFNRQDMDYLTLLSIHVAALVEHIA